MTRQPVTREQLLPIAYHLLRQWREHLTARPAHWSYSRRVEAVPALGFLQDFPREGTDGRDPVAALMEVIPADYRDPAATWIRVSLEGMVYDEYHQWGDGSAHVAIAEWLECAIPGATVFYGPANRDELELFDATRRQGMLADFLKAEGRASGTGPDCSLCRFPMHDFHEGEEPDEEWDLHPEMGFSTYRCHGCQSELTIPEVLTRAGGPGGFRDVVVEVLPWAAVNHEEVLKVIFDTPAHLWAAVTKSDFAKWLSHPREEVREAGIRLLASDE